MDEYYELMDECYELAISTMFLGGLIINYMEAHPNADVLDILNPEDTILNQLARKVLEIKGVSSNFFRLNQNTFNGGSNPENNNNNKENINKFMIAFNKLPSEKQEKIKKLREIIRETFCKKNISVVGGTKRQRINKRKSTKKKWKKTIRIT